MTEPKRIWWARPRKLCALERPGGGGRSHRPERRGEEIAWLKSKGVRTVVSIMRTQHNLEAYEEAGLEWVHAPVEDGDDPAELVPLVRRHLRGAGAVAVHGDHRTDLAVRVCAELLDAVYDVPIEEGLASAAAAGLSPR